MTKPRSFSDVLAETGLKQGQLATEAHLHQTTISKAFRGLPIERQTAKQMLYALNRLRKERKLAELGFGEIDWNLVD